MMPEEAPPPDDPSATSETTENTTNANTPEALQERIRTLRLWADHVEARLAEKTEQADTWRKRAEERKERIDELQAGLGTTRRRLRAFWKRLMWSATPETPTETQSAPRPTKPELTDGQPRLDPRLSRLVHPTVRLGVVAPSSAAMPPLLGRMNTTMIQDPSSAPAVRSVDVLVTVGAEGGELAKTVEATREWMEDGNPTVGVGSPMPGHHSVDISDLAYFDENDDIFDTVSDSGRPDVNQNIQPTLYAMSLASPSKRLESIAEMIASESRPVEQERMAVSHLRQLREESSARAVAERLLQAAGVAVPHWRREALAVLVSKRPDFVVEATDRMVEQTYRPLRIAVGLHGPAGEAEQVVRQRLAKSEIPYTVARFQSTISQGACLNALVEDTAGDVIIKIDDDDWYSPVFIADMMGALDFSGAAIVGKASAFVRLRDGHFVLLRTSSYREVDHVVGPTITAHRWAWEAVRFPNRYERVDSKFLQAARSMGLRVVSHHPWDFCVIRHDRGHSWTASDDYFLAAGRTVDIDWERICTD